MPFTVSHPAAVLPFVRPPFSAVALVAGAVAPDMPYFVGSIGIAVSAQSWYEPFLNATTSHSLRGMVTIDLAYALALCGLACVARRPVGVLLPGLAGPGSLRTRTPRALLVGGGWMLLSLLVGIATHLVWDSFTHGDGYVVSRVSWLRSSLAGGDLTWSRALQHASTIGGLAAIGRSLWRRRSRLTQGEAAPQGSPGRRRRLVLLSVIGAVVLAAAVASAAGGSAGADGQSTGQVVEGMLADGAKGAGAALVGALIIHTTIWWVLRVVVAVRDGA